MPDLTKLPRYQSHKVVRASVIMALAKDADGNVVSVIVADLGDPIQVTGNPFKAGEKMPEPGDYLVVYDNEDGTEYGSWSPKAPFEAGYTKLEQYQKPRT